MTPILLIILDGFGEGKIYPGNAVTLARTPTLTALKKKYPWTVLKASGEAVGTPKGTQGGSEVSHYTIGAGRVIFQSLEEINRAIRDRSFFQKPDLLAACAHVMKSNRAALHLVGMISDQGVHSHLHHLFALLELVRDKGVFKIYIHAITDGRDVHERSAAVYVQQINEKIKELGLEKRAKIATIIGRYYAMDRDANWDRIQKAYDLYTFGKGTSEKNPVDAITHAYERGSATDYYIYPIILDEHGIINDKDAVIFWNFRSDRARQLTWSFTGELNSKTGTTVGFFQKKIVRPFFVCFGPYSHKAPVVFPPPLVKHNLGEIISAYGLRQFRIAETEKYAHVTYFFNGQVENAFPGEERFMVESPKCPSYAEKPQMSAYEITDALLLRLASKKYALIIVNFANCDLVGHSGNLNAAIKAVEIVDECLGRIVPEALASGYTTIVTGDHGNVEYMIYEDSGEPCPSHTTNPVPFIVINKDRVSLTRSKKGELKDIAPTILQIMGLLQPAEMTGQSLIA